MSYLLMGYDVENYLEPSLRKKLDWKVTIRFLNQMSRLHRDLNAPCTLFICGRLLKVKSVLEILKKLSQSELFDLQQHTYSHQRLKTVIQDGQEFKGASPRIIRKEIKKTNKLFEIRLGIHPQGLCGPFGYYQGLKDRVDILEILSQSGIRFTRTFLRPKTDGPLSIRVQPFTYRKQGFDKILEIPSQGWQDILYFRKFGWNHEKFLKYNKKTVRKIAQENLVWSVCQHDWTSCVKDPQMDYTRKLLEYAQHKGVTITTHKNFFKKFLTKQRS